MPVSIYAEESCGVNVCDFQCELSRTSNRVGCGHRSDCVYGILCHSVYVLMRKGTFFSEKTQVIFL